MIKRYHAPATPYERALAHPKVTAGRQEAAARAVSHARSGGAVGRDPRRPGGTRQSRRSSRRTSARPAHCRRVSPSPRRRRLCEDARQDGRGRRAARHAPATRSGLTRRGFACRPSSIRIWPRSRAGLRREPQLTALAIVGRLTERRPEQFGHEAAFDRAASAEGASEEGSRDTSSLRSRSAHDDRYLIARACGRLGL